MSAIHTRKHTHIHSVYLVKLAVYPGVNRVCVLTTNGASVSHLLYNVCESVAVSSGPPGVFEFPVWVKTKLISGEKVKSAMTFCIVVLSCAV